MRVPSIMELYREEAENRTKVLFLLTKFPDMKIIIHPGEPLLN